MNQISQLSPPKCENIIKVRGEIRLPEGSVFYPQWKTSGSNPVYGVTKMLAKLWFMTPKLLMSSPTNLENHSL